MEPEPVCPTAEYDPVEKEMLVAPVAGVVNAKRPTIGLPSYPTVPKYVPLLV